eukprot:TRINITY_DN8833_c0_g3_i1.p2 TRINITY_DN8833_c0_g3~~TRINITY_DN8833_c0_g3_i1.p2  ORF type:complete len:114 (-),score=10.65 TRINITY_DN8833_c0_g3_i1:670-1011(-)
MQSVTYFRQFFRQCVVNNRHPSLISGLRYFSQEIAHTELEVEQKLRQNLDIIDIKAKDISGGCGTMFSIQVEANDFKGKNTVQQHAMIYKVFKKELADQWHGVELSTKAPSTA